MLILLGFAGIETLFSQVLSPRLAALAQRYGQVQLAGVKPHAGIRSTFIWEFSDVSRLDDPRGVQTARSRSNVFLRT